MKHYFIKLFNYDAYANKRLLQAIMDSHQPEKAVQLMAHLLSAQQFWLNRCKDLPVTGALWPDWQADTFENLINQNHAGWIAYIERLNAVDFENKIHYKNTKGESYSNKLEDMLAHVINHGTHHRAQIGQVIKFAGMEQIPNSDYIFYTREQNL